MDITNNLNNILLNMPREFFALSFLKQESICKTMVGMGANWDIYELAWDKPAFKSLTANCGTNKPCLNTVTVNSTCYYPEEVNYLLWGLANRICKDGGFPYPTGGLIKVKDKSKHTEYYVEMMIQLYRSLYLNIGQKGRIAWAKAGYNKNLIPKEDVHVQGCIPCPDCYKGILFAYIGNDSFVYDSKGKFSFRSRLSIFY